MSKAEELAEVNEEILLIDEFESALIGYVEGAGSSAVAAYDKDQVIQTLIADGCTEEDALEHFYYNVAGSYAGENTPVFITFLEVPNE